MAISKITVNGSTLIDLSNDTVEADKLVISKTAHKSDGSKVNGNMPDVESSLYVDSDDILHYARFTVEPCRLRVMTYNAGGWYVGENEHNVPLHDETRPDTLQFFLQLQREIMERNRPSIAVFQEAWQYFAGDKNTSGSILATDVIKEYFPAGIIQFDRESKHYCHAIASRHFPLFDYRHCRFDVYDYTTEMCQEFVPVWMAPSSEHPYYNVNEFVHYPTVTDPIYQSLSSENTATPTDASKWKLADWFYGYEKAYIMVNGHKICIANIWLDSNDTYYGEYREKEIEQVINDLENEEYFVLMGDFNTNCRAYEDYYYNRYVLPFVEAGFHVCNNALNENNVFVNEQTYYRRKRTDTRRSDALDNIITSSNIIVEDFFVDETKKNTLDLIGPFNDTAPYDNDPYYKVDHLPVIADLIIN